MKTISLLALITALGLGLLVANVGLQSRWPKVGAKNTDSTNLWKCP